MSRCAGVVGVRGGWDHRLYVDLTEEVFFIFYLFLRE